MTSAKTLNAKNLAALGAARLAAIVLEITAGDVQAKRRLRLELASQAGGDEVAAQVRKRLVSIGKSRSFVSWRKMRGLQQDLETQLRAVTELIAPTQPAEAFDLLWRFAALAPSLYERCDDSNDGISYIISQVIAALGALAPIAKMPSLALAERIYEALCSNSYGQYDDLIPLLAEPLGRDGLGYLKTKFESMTPALQLDLPDAERRVIGISSRGVVYEDDAERRAQLRTIQSALTQIADAAGDVDSYIAIYADEDRKNPAIAARIADRLLVAGRAEEAYGALALAQPMRRKGGHWPDWDRVKVNVLDALGHLSDAQNLRWDLFEHDLAADWLRQYLKKLPDFEDMEAEERAIAYAGGFPDFHRALFFLLEWPALPAANQLILARCAQIDGTHYELLSTAASALEYAHPLAATLVLRAMIDFALENARHKRYRHAARHLKACESLARKIEDYGEHKSHTAYLANIKSAHKQKLGFWNALA